MALDWEKIRQNKWASDTSPDGWPAGVRPISQTGLSLFGIDPATNDLFWDGRRVETTKRLANYERALATIGAAGAFLAGVHPFGHSFGWW